MAHVPQPVSYFSRDVNHEILLLALGHILGILQATVVIPRTRSKLWAASELQRAQVGAHSSGGVIR